MSEVNFANYDPTGFFQRLTIKNKPFAFMYKDRERKLASIQAHIVQRTQSDNYQKWAKKYLTS